MLTIGVVACYYLGPPALAFVRGPLFWPLLINIAVFGIPLFFVFLCWGELYRFVFPSRAKQRPHLEETPNFSEIDADQDNEESTGSGKKLRWQKTAGLVPVALGRPGRVSMMNQRKRHRRPIQFGLGQLFVVFTAGTIVAYLFGPAMIRFVWIWPPITTPEAIAIVGPIVVMAVLVVICWNDVFGFASPSATKHRRQRDECPDFSQLQTDESNRTNDEKTSKKLRWKQADAYYQPPGIGPRGFR